MRIPEGAALTPDGLRRHRETYVAAMRADNAGAVTRCMRSWTEMEDKDLSAQDGA